MFAKLTGDLSKLHLDDEYAKRTIFGARISHGLLTLGIGLGLWYSLDVNNDSILAFVGINKLRFKGPVYVGDRIRLISEVVSKRESKSRPEAGIVSFGDQILNQNGGVVLDYERVEMISKRDET